MYVCICNGYRDAEIREVAQSGVTCARRVYHALGSGPQCGQCLTLAQDLIDRFHDDTRVKAAEAVCFEATGLQGA